MSKSNLSFYCIETFIKIDSQNEPVKWLVIGTHSHLKGMQTHCIFLNCCTDFIVEMSHGYYLTHLL